MPRWLVTGSSGFLGRHIWRTLDVTPGVEPVALGRRFPLGWGPRGFVVADLDRPETLSRAFRSVEPDVVIHAAGKTPPATPEEFDRANARATLHLLSALSELGRPTRVVLIGSAAELGPVDAADLPVGEDHPCRPADAYSWSKCLATCCGLLAQEPLSVVVARVFNPIGPGLPAKQALGGFAARLVHREPGPFLVGDLDIRRDFVDVRDVARAIVALALRGRTGRIYHVGTGESRRVGDGLEGLMRRSGRSIDVRVDPRLVEKAGPRDSRADIRKIATETGWRPTIAWEQSLDDLWNDAISAARLPLTA